jgi:hypothetical protein
MYRFGLVFLSLCAVQPVSAASADLMFQELSKDFGSVPRGPTLQHAFHLKNNSANVVHIANVRVSCGCVSAYAMKDTLQPGEESAVVASMDTTRWPGGVKSVTVYVLFDAPHTEEVRLWVRANGRDDVNVSPDTLAFGQIKRGNTPASAVRITFLGTPDARVLEVTPESNYVQPTIREVSRQGSEVAYELTARLRGDAPAGKWYTDIWLRTNNESMPRVRVPLTVEIESLLSVNPPAVALGEVKVGAEAERKVIVRGVKPFKITGVKGTDTVLSVKDSANVSKYVHVLTVKVRSAKAGTLTRNLEIITDLEGDNRIDVSASARVIP